MTNRKIIHVDMDAFFASVEQRDDPTLLGKPVVVGGNPYGRGVVAAASYEARAFGIRSAMPCAQAARLCAEAVFVRPHFAAYKAVSHQIHAIFQDYTPIVEPLSLDEAYLDVTENKKDIPYASTIAREIRERIRAELDLTASAGVGPTKFVAKLASDHDKPNGLVVVQPHEVMGFISGQPLERLWGVGPATATKLHALDAETIGDVAGISKLELEQALGSAGRFISELANGRDPRPVRSERTPKSRGAETTFGENKTDVEELRGVLRNLSADVANSLTRVERPARTITVKVRYDTFETVTRSQTVARPTWDAEEIWETACVLLDRTEAGEQPVRLVGVSASNLYASQEVAQLELPLYPGV